MSDEPSNVASHYAVRGFELVNRSRLLGEEFLRATLADDFAFESRRSGLVLFGDMNAEQYTSMVESVWDTGAGGRPRWAHQTLAVRGERFAALAVRLDYGNGMLTETIQVVGLDPTLSLLQRSIHFDHDDVDGAIAELDRLHRQSEES